MGFLDELTGTQKLIGLGIVGAGALLLFSRGGGGQSGLAVVDVRRPTDDMNTPGAAWGGDGYQYFAEINRSNNELLRNIWGSQNPANPNAPVAPATPPVPTTPTPSIGGMGPWDRRSLIGDLQLRRRVNRLAINEIRENGVTGAERERIQTLRKRNNIFGSRLEELGAPIPMPDPRAPGQPTPRPRRDEGIVR